MFVRLHINVRDSNFVVFPKQQSEVIHTEEPSTSVLLVHSFCPSVNFPPLHIIKELKEYPTSLCQVHLFTFVMEVRGDV